MLEIQLGDTLEADFTTHNDAGANVNADATPTFTVYKNGSAVVALTNQNATNYGTGLYRCLAAITAANGFALGDILLVNCTFVDGAYIAASGGQGDGGNLYYGGNGGNITILSAITLGTVEIYANGGNGADGVTIGEKGATGGDAGVITVQSMLAKTYNTSGTVSIAANGGEGGRGGVYDEYMTGEGAGGDGGDAGSIYVNHCFVALSSPLTGLSLTANGGRSGDNYSGSSANGLGGLSGTIELHHTNAENVTTTVATTTTANNGGAVRAYHSRISDVNVSGIASGSTGTLHTEFSYISSTSGGAPTTKSGYFSYVSGVTYDTYS